MAMKKTEKREVEVVVGNLTATLHVVDGELSSVSASTRGVDGRPAAIMPMVDAGVFMRVAKIAQEVRDELRDYRSICLEHGWLERWTECEVCHPPTPKVAPEAKPMAEVLPS